MKIVIITSHWNGGGAESVARDLFFYLNNMGHECYYLYANGASADIERTIKCSNKIQHYMHALGARLFDLNGYGSSWATVKLIKQIEEINPDVINIHNLVCYAFNLKILFDYLRNCKKKIVWTLHDCWTFTGHCISFDAKNCSKWKTGCGKCPAKKDYPKSLFLDRSACNLMRKRKLFTNIESMMLVTPSNWLKSVVTESYMGEYNIAVINNGIDLNEFKYVKTSNPKIINLNDKRIILAVASRWTDGKGLSFIKELNKIIDKSIYKIVVVGRIDNDILPESIIHIERTRDKRELAEWYSAATVFINPSIADNFPTVNLEALACGTPVVTFDTGGSWESVGNECGCLMKTNSASALLQGIMECERKMIDRITCEKHAMFFSKENRYSEYESLFKTLVSS